MGVDAADINADGWEDLFVSNISYEMFSLYTNNKNETFFDAAPNTVSRRPRVYSAAGVSSSLTTTMTARST